MMNDGGARRLNHVLDLNEDQGPCQFRAKGGKAFPMPGTSTTRDNHGLPGASVVPAGGITSWSVLLIFLVISLSACNLFRSRDSMLRYDLPLTVQIRPDASITGAVLEYRDACGQPAQVKIDGILQETLKRKLGLVFQHTVFEASAVPGAVDGVVDVGLGLKELDLFVPRRTTRTYPATVTLGLDFSYSDLDGTIRHSKKLQSQGHDDVGTTKDSCEVKGVEAVVQQAADLVVEGMAKQLGDSSRIREAAQSAKSRPRAAGQPSGQRASEPAVMSSASAPASPGVIQSVVALPTLSAPSTDRHESGPTKLSFRTIIRDENRNQVLERNEHFIVEFEIKNEGGAVADNVEVHLTGHPAVLHNLKAPLLVGTIGPGEIKRVSVAGTLGGVSEVEAAELVCSLRASSPVELPPSKKFVVAIRPETVDAVEVLSVDVDQIANHPGKLKQAQGIGIAIGVGQFRDANVPEARFAGRDAEVMAKYFSTYMGIPSARVKLLEDGQVLKDDLIDVFETWLPTQVDPRAVVLVYFSGRAVVEASTGAVSLVPYDGSASSRLFSLARLQRALTRAQVSRAILLLDLSLEPTPGTEAGRAITPVWEEGELAQHKDRFMWMIGNNSLQEAHAYQQGQHGLFTYYLLKGLRGAADLDKNGTVLTGELCTYVHRQVEAVAKHQFGNAQEPVCLPDVGHTSPLRVLPLSKLR